VTARIWFGDPMGPDMYPLGEDTTGAPVFVDADGVQALTELRGARDVAVVRTDPEETE